MVATKEINIYLNINALKDQEKNDRMYFLCLFFVIFNKNRRFIKNLFVNIYYFR